MFSHGKERFMLFVLAQAFVRTRTQRARTRRDRLTSHSAVASDLLFLFLASLSGCTSGIYKGLGQKKGFKSY